MLAANLDTTTDSELLATLHAIEEPVVEPEPKSGLKAALLITLGVLIVAAGWFFFTDLFSLRSGASTPPLIDLPAPSQTPSATALFVPSETPSRPKIALPVVDAEKEAVAAEPELKADSQSDKADAPAVTAKTVKTNVPSGSSSSRRIAPPAVEQKPAERVRRNEDSAPTRKPAYAPVAPVIPVAPQVVTTLPPEPAGASQRPVRAVETVPPASTVEREIVPISSRAPDRSVDEVLNLDTTSRTPSPMAAPSVAPSATPSVAMVQPSTPFTKKLARRNYGLVVIVNKANAKTLSRSDIGNIYRDRVTRWPSGERIVVLNLPLDSSEHQRFSTAILDMSSLDAATERSNRAITNRGQNEYRTKNPQAVVSYVERHENAIGYVPAAALDDNDDVRVVFSIP